MASPATSISSVSLFRERYYALTDRAPFRWQEQLWLDLLADNFCPAITLPTGTGKTSLMHVWMLALAHQAQAVPSQRSLARRLVWVVNRRVVVDQATDEAVEIARKL